MQSAAAPSFARKFRPRGGTPVFASSRRAPPCQRALSTIGEFSTPSAGREKIAAQGNGLGSGAMTAGHQLNLLWEPPGPVAARFMASQARVQIINGPIGSGKTTCAFIKAIRLATRQAPSTTELTMFDGVMCPTRKFKLCVVRDTYRQLWKTTLPSWFKRVPRSAGQFVGAENAPASHRILLALADGTVVDFLVEFGAIGDNDPQDFMRGYEPTAFYINEADLVAREIFTYAKGRVGRYPDMSEGGPTWYGILMDCNAPELTNWLYLDVFRRTPEEMAADGVELFRQPGGQSPGAENLKNLPPGYYDEQCKGAEAWYIARMIDNKPGHSRAGKPIYPEFNDTLHVAEQRLEPIPGLPLIIGLDAGLTPAAALGQRAPNGQWRILAEMVSEPGVGAKRFAQRLSQLLHERFEGFRVVAYADPSAAYGADKQAGEHSWIDIVAMEAAIQVDAAPSNALTRRLEAVRLPLTRLIDGHPGFLISAACTMLREGFNSGYHFKKFQIGAEERYAEEPEKNGYSHPHDALQYLMSGGGEDIEVMYRREERDHATRQGMAMNEDHPWGEFQGGRNGRQGFAVGEP